MMEKTEQYEKKIESMKKYVPLLSKLITQLQEKNENNAEIIKKITQLKILQQQLCDPKPGILLEELNKCEQVLKNLFELHENVTYDETKTTPQANEDKEMSTHESSILNHNGREMIASFNESDCDGLKNPMDSKNEPAETNTTPEENEDEQMGTQESSILKHNERENIVSLNESNCYISNKTMDTNKESDETETKLQANIDEELSTQDQSISNDNSIEAKKESTNNPGECRNTENLTNHEIHLKPQTEDDNKQNIQTVSTVLIDNNQKKDPTLDKTNCVESSTSPNNIGEKNCNTTQDNKNPKDTEKMEEMNAELMNTSEHSATEIAQGSENFNENNSKLAEKPNTSELESLSESFEERNVEIIEFSENESESEDEGELIVPDEESAYVKQAYDNQDTCNETKVLMDSSKSTPNLVESQSEDDTTNEQSKEAKINSNVIEENKETDLINHKADPAADNFGEKISDQEETATIETPQSNINLKETISEGMELIEPQEQQHEQTKNSDKIEKAATIFENKERLIKNNESILDQSGQKRSATQNTDDSTAKKQKLSDVDEFSTDNEEIVADPLAIDNGNNITKSDYENDNDNDDVEIIEQRNSPILIDSDDEYIKILEPIPKKAIKRPSFAFKSTNPNKIHNKELKNSGKIKIMHFNVARKPGFTRKPTKNIEFIPKPQHTRKPTPKPPPPRNQQSNFLSNMDLQPSPGKGTNPRHFKTCVGEKTLLIPNAFYCSGRQNHTVPEQTTITEKLVSNPPSNALPDAAHCRWLENFLQNFCSPRNRAHNTCYLILKRALRPDDYDRICNSRGAMNPCDKDINMRLLVQMRNIFYVYGNHKLQKLTHVGRKFCQLAFVNIMDKTISLTTDTVTNEVTSRTRISTATVKTARSEMLTSTASMENTKMSGNDLIYPHLTVSTIARTIVTIPDTLQSSSSFRKGREDDVEYCPPREVTNSSTESPPRRSLRNPARRQSTCENSERFTYSETDDDEIVVDVTNVEEQQKREKIHFTAATEAYIIQKRLAAQQKREKQAKSFETAFTDTIVQSANSSSKVLTSITSERSSSNTLSENNSEVLVISDDEEDVQQVLLDDLTEPQPHLIHKASGTVTTKLGDMFTTICKTQMFSNGTKQQLENKSNYEQDNATMKIFEKGIHNAPETASHYIFNGQPKNISSEIHSMSRYNDYCLLCNRPVTRVVGHYVNSHPKNEVFISRPSPKMARNMLNNKLDPAAYDRLQNGLSLYIATCVFCEKKGSFTLPYWYQHFASHTGEYAYQCTGCGLRKPTRSQLSLHVRQNCPQNGDMKVIQEYDLSLLKINGYTCRLCNYTQMGLGNVLKHLQNQHDMTRVEKCNWGNVTLLHIPKSVSKGKQINNAANKTQNAPFYVHSENNEIFEIAEIDDVNYIENNDGQPVVVNEAVTENNWYENSTVITNTLPCINYEIKKDEI